MRTALYLLLLLLPAALLAQRNDPSASALSNFQSLTKLSPEQRPVQQSDPQLTARMNAQMTAQRPTAVFEENKGQMKDQHWQPRPDVLFNGSANGMAYYVRDNGMSYQLSRVESWKEEEDDRFNMPGTEKRQVPDQMGTYRVDVQWTDFNTDYTVEKGAELPGYTNYYNVPEGVEPALFVKQYESVTLRGLYDGIDLHLYGTDGHLETDWLVAPGADYTQIGFEVKGAALSVDAEGHLIMGTPFGEIREGTLKVFQEGRLLEAYWRLSALTDSSGTVSFEVMGHDPMLAMRIDPPVLVWGTYYGGNGTNHGHSVATHIDGGVLMAGKAHSSNMATSGAHQTSSGTNGSSILLKMNDLGVRQWCTYYGAGNTVGYACTTDGEGSIFLAGATGAPSFGPFNTSIYTPGSHQPFKSGNSENAFLVKFNSAGIRIWGTYYGSGSTIARSCATDIVGNVYICGETSSPDYIASDGAHQDVNPSPGSMSAFMAKFNGNGVRQWGTYYGGNGGDYGTACVTDTMGNVYLSGSTTSGSNIATPGSHQANYLAVSNSFLIKFNSEGERVWGTYYGGNSNSWAQSCTADAVGNVYLTGSAGSNTSIATPGVHQTSNAGLYDAYLVKFNSSGIRQWGTYFGGNGEDIGYSCAVDSAGYIYMTGETSSSNNVATPLALKTSYGGNVDGFIVKFTPNGTRLWGTYSGGSGWDVARSCAVDNHGAVYFCGYSSANPSFISENAFQTDLGGFTGAALLSKLITSNIHGRVFLDIDQNCIQAPNENVGMEGITLVIQPGDLVVQTDENGRWNLVSLPIGEYEITIDTTIANWHITCPPVQSFEVVDDVSFVLAPSFGMFPAYPCPSPDVSISMPQMRRGFENQWVHVSACNTLGSDTLAEAYCIVELDEHISVQSASLPFTELGDNQFQLAIGDLLPGQCVNFTLSATVELSAVANQTLCLSAELYPQPECVFDTVPDPYPPTVAPCDSAWDGSSLTVEAHCDGDSVYFTVSNAGEDMACFAPVRVYVNGNQVILDSLMLAGGDSAVFTYLGNGQTWRLEADQHPYHPGSSNPSAHMEICGSSGFQPFIVTMFPQDDADPVVDIFCDQVSAPYDPNDKTGSPRGLGETHAIQRGQQIEYLVRFQNIGTDTAVNVVILDTLSTDLNIFTVQSGVSSHPYEFRMYGPRVLEWRFNNILLPDSTTDEPGSNGFVMFKVQQVPDLPYGTVIENTANIYFDFEEPVITNTYFHTITDFSGTLFPEPEAGILTSETGLLCEVGSIMLTATYGDSYLWSSGQATQSIEVTEEGQYSVTVTYSGGFVSTAGPLAINENPEVTYTGLPDSVSLYASSIPLTGLPEGGTFSGEGITGNMFNPIDAGIGEHCITYTYSDEFGCSGLMTQCVVVELFAGIGEYDGVSFTVFPNPGNGLFTLVTSEGGAVRLTVTDISGREVLQESYTATAGTAHSIDISKQANGIYTLRIETEKGTGGVRLVKE